MNTLKDTDWDLPNLDALRMALLARGSSAWPDGAGIGVAGLQLVISAARTPGAELPPDLLGHPDLTAAAERLGLQLPGSSAPPESADSPAEAKE